MNVAEETSSGNSESVVRSSRRQRSGGIMVKGGVAKKKLKEWRGFFLWTAMLLVLVQMGRYDRWLGKANAEMLMVLWLVHQIQDGEL